MNYLELIILILTGIGLIFTALTLRLALRDYRLVACSAPASWHDVELIVGRRDTRHRALHETLRLSKHLVLFVGALWWVMQWPAWIEVRSIAMAYVSILLMLNSAIGLYMRRKMLRALREHVPKKDVT